MATKRGPRTRRRHQKKKQFTRRYRRDPTVRRGIGSLPPKVESNLVYSNTNEEYSPVSSPGNSNRNNNKTPNSPITKKAKMLASLYPNRQTMIKRSMSFEASNNVPNNAWWKRMEEEFGTENQEFFRD